MLAVVTFSLSACYAIFESFIVWFVTTEREQWPMTSASVKYLTEVVSERDEGAFLDLRGSKKGTSGKQGCKQRLRLLFLCWFFPKI